MNSSYNSHHHDGANGSTGGGTKVMSLLEEVDAFISQKDAAAPVSSSGRSSIMAGPSTMIHHPSKAATATVATHPCKRRISADMEETNNSTRCQYPSSSSSSTTSAASSDAATSAVAAFLQNQVQQEAQRSAASPQEQQQQQHHRSKRQRRDEDRSLSLSPKTLGGLDSFALDLHMPVSESSFGSNDNEPLPIFPPQQQQEPPMQQQQLQPQRLQLQPMSKQPRLPTKQQAFYRPPAHRVSLADRTFPSSTAPAPAPLTAGQPPAAASRAAATTKPANAGSASAAATNFNLHRVCNFFASKREVVEIALALDPSAIRRKADPVVAQQNSSGAATTVVTANHNNNKPTSSSWVVLGSVLQKCGLSRERYSYPVNIALQNKASMDVLELLVQHGRDVLVEKDGYERTGSLSIALCQRPCDLDLIDLILFANVQGIMVTDRKLNYPLHVACAKGASVDVIMRLYHHYPAALFQQNFNSETPLDICRRSSIISEGALNFLLERFNEGCLKVAKNNYQNRHQ